MKNENSKQLCKTILFFLHCNYFYHFKVLDIDLTKDDKGRKVYEYYIHFQGWNKR